MVDLFKRIKEANKNSAAYYHDPRDTSLRGHEAEQEVCNQLAPRLIGTGWELVNGVRVPDPTARRRRELDFVITSPSEALVLEMKNWTGEVGLDEDGNVVQINRNGEKINAGNLFNDVEERTEILRLHHSSTGRAPVKLRHFVVFYDPYGNLYLRDDIANRGDVLRFDALSKLMPAGEEPFLRRLLHALLRFFGFEPERVNAPAPSPEILAFRQSLAELGGWDVLVLNGGLTLCGDILSIAGSRPDRAEYAAFNRARMAHLEFDVDRSLVASIFRAPSPDAKVNGTARDGSVTTTSVPTAAEVTFHRSGDKKPSHYEVRNLQSAQFGYLAKPKTTYRYEDFSVGMTVVGKVAAINDKGTFIDIGYRELAGKPRHARAKSTRPGTLTVGQRVLARIIRLIEDGNRVSVEVLEPRMT
ncbi:nuclease-related domain-containing protein [Burkholderia sp. MBR-1]|uniref:nuclease-related domain-containing protein n=1 Tax=Burkholderia sp. MBR-1 TaxID=2732364 RepID=UPI0015EFC6CC|nr:nuclease-related domain-containing protein [Burkholderia sp. MBR-1]QMI49896.1 hypothetical protein MBR110_31035 [Burkholderia sp. MBR-1]